MNTKSVLYLIELLKKNTLGEEEALKDIYLKAVSDSDEYLELINNLENNLFFGVTGKSIQEEGNRYVKEVRQNPDNVMELMKEIQQFNELVESDIKKGKSRIEYPGSFLEEINIVEKNKIEIYDLFFSQLASVITYIIAMEEGFEGLNNLFWKADSGLTNKIHSINNTFLPKLLSIDNSLQPWAIYKVLNKNDIKFCPYEYQLKYISSEQYEELINRSDYKLVMPMKYGNARVFGEDVVDVPIYCGKGNFVSSNPLEAIDLLHLGVVTKPKNPNSSMTYNKAPFIDVLIKTISYKSACIFSPQSITSVLNQWDNSLYIQKNINNHKCLLCGEPLNYGTVCQSHFSFRRG